MERKQFIKGILGTTILLSMDSLSILANAITLQNATNTVHSDEMASFGAVHLNNTSIEKAITFWTKVIGMKLRHQTTSTAEFGTAKNTLVVVHQTAKSAFKEGYSGLYHLAIHLPNKQEFAKAVYRLQQNNHRFSPIDHTMTQSLYLTDFDNVMVELALETPERFKRVITEGGLFMEDTDGTIRGASAPLDTNEILENLVEKNLDESITDHAKVGHIHFYAQDVVRNNTFYKKMGFTQFNFFPEYKYADLGAGGDYQHRIAMNSWHGNNKPLAPETNAGLKHYQIVFKSKEWLQNAIKTIEKIEEKEGHYWVKDPTGITIQLTHES